MAQYRALVGISYPPNKRVEAGEVVSDLPGNSIKWLLESNLIEPLDGKKIAEPTEKAKGFKPNAKDGDKDGFVQDATPFERPVEPEVGE